MKQIAKATWAAAIIFAALPNGVIASSDPSSDSSADPSLSARLRGTYASTFQQVCLDASVDGFDASSPPKPITPAKSVIESAAGQAIYKFDGRGSVMLANTTVLGISGPAYTGTGEQTVAPVLNPRTISGMGTYSLRRNGRVTITIRNAVFSLPNETIMVDQIPLSGQLGRDNKTLVLGISEPSIQKITSSTGAILGYRVCERSEVLVKQP